MEEEIKEAFETLFKEVEDLKEILLSERAKRQSRDVIEAAGQRGKVFEGDVRKNEADSELVARLVTLEQNLLDNHDLALKAATDALKNTERMDAWGITFKL